MVENITIEYLDKSLLKDQKIMDIATLNNKTVAEKYGISKQRVSQIKKANKARVEFLQQKLIADNLEDIEETFRLDISNNKAISKQYQDTNQYNPDKTAYKALVTKQIITPLMQRNDVSIFPSHANFNNFGSIQVNNQHNTVIKTVVAKAIGLSATKQLNDILECGVSDDTV